MKRNIIKLTGNDLHDNIETDSFVFDFENDDESDLIKLKKVGYKVSAFNHCYYYGYQFEKDIDSIKRTKFIHSLKFPEGNISEKDKNTFIINAVNKLVSDISLPSYELIVYTESMSEINRDRNREYSKMCEGIIDDILNKGENKSIDGFKVVSGFDGSLLLIMNILKIENPNNAYNHIYNSFNIECDIYGIK